MQCFERTKQKEKNTFIARVAKFFGGCFKTTKLVSYTGLAVLEHPPEKFCNPCNKGDFCAFEAQLTALGLLCLSELKRANCQKLHSVNCGDGAFDS